MNSMCVKISSALCSTMELHVHVHVCVHVHIHVCVHVHICECVHVQYVQLLLLLLFHRLLV